MHAGARFLLRALTARDLLRGGDGEAAAPAGLVTSADVAWAVLSQCHVTILETFQGSGARNDWPALRALGAGFWLPQGDPLRAALDAAAKVQFARRKDPQDCALLFVALGKKGQLQGLYKAVPACPGQVPRCLCRSSCCPSLLSCLPKLPAARRTRAEPPGRPAAQGPTRRLRRGRDALAKAADAAAPDTQAVRNEKLYTFLANDFSEPRWRSAALKNAFALLSKQQHELAAARAARLKRRLAALFGGHPRRVSREGSEG